MQEAAKLEFCLKNVVCSHCIHLDQFNRHIAICDLSTGIMFLYMQDFDHDGRLSFEDYSQAVDADTLLLEVLGQCLPDTKVSYFVKFNKCK